MGFCPSMENLPRRDGGAVVPMVGVLLVPVVTVRFGCVGQEKRFEFFKVSVAVGGGAMGRFNAVCCPMGCAGGMMVRLVLFALL